MKILYSRFYSNATIYWLKKKTQQFRHELEVQYGVDEEGVMNPSTSLRAGEEAEEAVAAD